MGEQEQKQPLPKPINSPKVEEQNQLSSIKEPINPKLKKYLIIFLVFLFILALIIIGYFIYKYKKLNIDINKKEANKISERLVSIKPTSTEEPEYSKIITYYADRMTYKFPVGAFGSYQGTFEVGPGRHGINFPQKYRLVMSSLLAVGGMGSPIDFEFEKPIEISYQYDNDVNYLKHLDEDNLTFLYIEDAIIASDSAWITLPTQIDKPHYITSTTGSYSGNYVLVAPLKCSEDISEFDDNYDASKAIREVSAIYYDGPGTAPKIQGLAFGKKIPRIFDIKQDEDWFHFEAKKGNTYRFEATDLAEGVKPLIIIYDNSGTKQIASSPMLLEWLPDDKYFQYSNEQTFFINVSAQLDSKIGCDASYNFMVTEIN